MVITILGVSGVRAKILCEQLAYCCLHFLGAQEIRKSLKNPRILPMENSIDTRGQIKAGFG